MEGELKTMGKAGKTGVTTNTPKNILFGAGTIHKNLKYTPGAQGAAGTRNFTESLMGATSGGSKLNIIPEVTKIEADGALVPVKGLSVKTGEAASMEINFLEITKDLLKAAVIGKDGTSEDATYDLIESKSNIEEGDYYDNIAFVGQTLDGRNVIAILNNALCTSGLELEGANKEGAVPAITFESHADIDGDLDTLQYKIYYPKAKA